MNLPGWVRYGPRFDGHNTVIDSPHREMIMSCVDRAKLSSLLNKWSGMEEDLYLMLCKKSTMARKKFNAMYLRKPVEEWTQVERENTLGHMLGFNIIQG